LKLTADELRALGVDPLVMGADLGVLEDLDRLVSNTLDRFGHVDILVNKRRLHGDPRVHI
jgi:NAD(P)-dependent dehydrogenase (short-subunit alcohol dehydrogenase family)